MQAWLAWMFAVNASSVFFWRRFPARWVLAAVPANMAAMLVLVRLYGPGHHISLPHIVFWTPLLAYLVFMRREVFERSPFGIWMACLFATDAISLVLDYRSVVQWLSA